MGSDAIYTAIKAMSDKDRGRDNKESIKNIKKINKPIKDNIIVQKSGGKKRGRPKKDEGMKKEKVQIHLEPAYIDLLKKEASTKGLDLGPYIASSYIIEPLKKKYEDLN